MCWCVHADHNQTGQFVISDWKLPVQLQKSTSSASAKESRTGPSSPADYRPISNLSTVSKVLKRLVLARLRPHLLGSTNFSQFQSAYRKGHCTETALIEVLDSVYTATDDKQVTVLVGLDLSAAFDTVATTRCSIAYRESLGWQERRCPGSSLTWMTGLNSSSLVTISHQPWASTLASLKDRYWDLLFTVYYSPVGDIIAKHGMQYRQYADDTPLHLAMRADNTSASAGLSVLAACTSNVRLVHAEQFAAQSWQAGGSDRRNVISAETSATSRPISDCRWGQPASIRADETAWRHLGPATDIREARHSGSKVVQLPCSSHLSHTTSHDAGTSTDVGL